jgi:hypothetical protein
MKDVNTKELTAKAYGSALFISIQIYLPDSNLCNLGANCPIKAGDLVEVTTKIPVRDEYPSVSEFFCFKYS